MPAPLLCRFCTTASLRVFRDARGRAWFFDAEPIADERTPAFCADPPRDVYVLHTRRLPAGPGERARRVGYVRAAADTSPAIVARASCLLRLHVCAPWLKHRAEQRQRRADEKLLGNVTSIGDATAQLLGFNSLAEAFPEPDPD